MKNIGWKCTAQVKLMPNMRLGMNNAKRCMYVIYVAHIWHKKRRSGYKRHLKKMDSEVRHAWHQKRCKQINAYYNIRNKQSINKGEY